MHIKPSDLVRTEYLSSRPEISGTTLGAQASDLTIASI